MRFGPEKMQAPQIETDASPQRSKFDRWLWERDVTNALAGKRLGCSAETVRRYRLPFGHTGRRIPDEATLAEIFGWTGGEITPGDFYPPSLTKAPPVPEHQR